MQRTCAIFKPDCVQKKAIGQVVSRIEAAGLTIRAMKMIHLSEGQAGAFYQVHEGKPFYQELKAFMTEGPVVVAVLEKEDAIQAWRSLMGATDPAKAEPGTIRRDLAVDVSRNMVHGSDSPETAVAEIAFFFAGAELAENL